MSTLVNFEVESEICTIRLNRPEALNALNQQMWSDVLAAMQRLAREPQIRAAILTGLGRSFCAGADLKETVWQDATQHQNRTRIEANQQQVARAMVAAPVPIIAAINGFAVGGGVEIPLAADIRVASENAQFWFPETSIGRFVTGGATVLPPRLVGLGQAKRLIYTGERIGAARALEIGLIDEMVGSHELMPRCLEMAQQIAANSPVSIALTKRLLDRGALADLETALTMETEALIATYSTGEVEAGVRAFAERVKTKD